MILLNLESYINYYKILDHLLLYKKDNINYVDLLK